MNIIKCILLGALLYLFDFIDARNAKQQYGNTRVRSILVIYCLIPCYKNAWAHCYDDATHIHFAVAIGVMHKH